MMDARRWLGIGFLVVLSVHLFFALSVPGFATDGSYFNLDQAQTIHDSGIPSFVGADPPDVFLPLFHYLIAPFVNNHIVLKILLSLLSSSVMLVVFLFAQALTQDEFAALYASLISGAIPVFFANTVVSVTPLSLFIPLLFALSYVFIQKNKKSALFIILLVALVLTSALSIIFALGLLVYVFLIYIEHVSQRRAEQELALLAVFLIILSLFFVFQSTLAVHQSDVFSGNSPAAVTAKESESLSLGSFVFSIGFVPFLFGLWVISQYLFVTKNRIVYFLSSLAAVTLALLMFNTVPIASAMSVFGVIVSILFAKGFQFAKDFLSSTRFSKHRSKILFTLFAIILLTSGGGSLASAALSVDKAMDADRLESIDALNDIVGPEDVVVSYYTDGHLINYATNGTAMIDARFFFSDAEIEYADHQRLLTTSFEITASELIAKYNISAIYISSDAVEAFNISLPRYAQNKECFRERFFNPKARVIVPNPNCQVRTVET